MTRDDLKKTCEEKGLVLTKHADRVLAMVNKSGGKCPCRTDGTVCPCPQLDDDIAKMGHCHCMLFAKEMK